MKHHHAICLSALLVTMGTLLIPSTHAAGPGPYDIAADFSTAANPNGVWQYGYSLALGGALQLHLSNSAHPAYTTIDNWHTDLGYGIPVVMRNSTDATVINDTGTIRLAPGQLASHPGTSGEYSVVRFTAPNAGLFNLSGDFTGVDLFNTSTDVHLLLNGSPFFSGTVLGFGIGSGPSFNTNLVLNAGDQLDFAVGWGNGNFSYVPPASRH